MGTDVSRSHGRKRKVTDEEIAEYLAKKAQKKAAKVATKMKTQHITGYANESNPFNDPNLNERFVWRKRIERDITRGVPLDAYSLKSERNRHRERMAEMEKMKKRREERAVEKARREEETALLAREGARAEFEDWERKEGEFAFNQFKVGSEIRVRERRMKPIDELINNLKPVDEILRGLDEDEIEGLREDIKLCMDSDPTRRQYWEALLVVCDRELGEVIAPAMHSSIEADVLNLLYGISHDELEALQSEIESQMRSGEAKVVEYWEALVKHLHIFKARACLREMQVNHRLDQVGDSHEYESKEPDAGSFSPELVHGEDGEEGVDPEQDKAILEQKRLAVDAMFGLNKEITPDSQNRYRKPKYLNRVHTGYEWNKYNQTHYDYDNPPPKMVQGYKFDVFYPDLIKGKAPGYTIERDGESAEKCIIRFHAGPPYEDIAFRIVNREWEYSQKKGFKSSFERGVLRLYFNFRRYRYRR